MAQWQAFGDDLNGGETFAGEGVWYGLSRRARWSYIGISSATLSSEESSDEADAAFLEYLATDSFFEARGETDFLFFFSFQAKALSLFSSTYCWVNSTFLCSKWFFFASLASRLALAFSLFATSPGKSAMVFKESAWAFGGGAGLTYSSTCRR